ncbi:MAG TPA: Do family serine endopeptidase [Steroidobacteraceae bacterium]|nr:Do family serine endopeptidase [Steroidobacteraceae bacterium]
MRPCTIALLAGLGLSIAQLSAAAAAHPKKTPPPVVQPKEEPQVPSLSPMIKRVAPAVVYVTVSGTVPAPVPVNPLFEEPGTRPFRGAGSGVIVDAVNGYIITNAHVVEGATDIIVTLADDRQVPAQVKARDERSDIALLQVKSANLVQIPLGDSSRLEVGDYVVAIGNPFGLQHTVTSGIVSALGRSGINPDNFEDFIQTDASINMGNSGGALVNLRGELVGINTAIVSRTGDNTGIGFAIPVNMVRTVYEQLLRFGAVKRGLLGVNIYTMTPDDADNLGVSGVHGAVVSQVIEGSTAESAGIKTGDVITSVNTQPVKSAAELRNAIGLLRAGDQVEISLLREGKPRKLTATITEASETQAADNAPIHRGLAGTELVDGEGGVLVKSVEETSLAAQAGLRPNDVIVAVNRAHVSKVKELRDQTKDARALWLDVRRGARALLIVVR